MEKEMGADEAEGCEIWYTGLKFYNDITHSFWLSIFY